MRIEINVTQEDIARGQRHSLCRCPIALAARRLHLRRICVTGGIEFMHGRRRYWGALPKGALTFIRKYDAGERVAPLRFNFVGEERFDESRA